MRKSPKKPEAKKHGVKESIPTSSGFKGYLESVMNNRGEGKGVLEEAVSYQMAGLEFDYRYLFTDALSKDLVIQLGQRLAESKSAPEAEEAAFNVKFMLTMYSVAVYYIYPTKEWLKKSVDSDKELSSNFKMVKGWLDGHGGKVWADQYVATLMGQIGSEKERTEFI